MRRHSASTGLELGFVGSWRDDGCIAADLEVTGNCRYTRMEDRNSNLKDRLIKKLFYFRF